MPDDRHNTKPNRVTSHPNAGDLAAATRKVVGRSGGDAHRLRKIQKMRG
jgi:hypothetical protein